MKKFRIILITFLSCHFLSTAQCVENGFSFGNNIGIPSYNVTGDVIVTLNDGGQTISLDLGNNFRTAFGPDIRAYLVDSNGLSGTQLADTRIESLENIMFGLVGSNTVNQNGAKSFTVDIPNGVDIRDYDRIFFYCLEFGQFWDFGSYTPFSNTTCNILSIGENTIEKTTVIYPNPTSNTLNISNTTNIVSKVRIFNTEGNLVLDKKQNLDQIDTSALSTGLYLVELTSQSQTGTKSLIIK